MGFEWGAGSHVIGEMKEADEIKSGNRVINRNAMMRYPLLVSLELVQWTLLRTSKVMSVITSDDLICPVIHI